MSFYILSSLSYINNNEYKFGFSSKSKNELLYQYKKNKRLIPNPFIIKWWDNKGNISIEKKIHNILKNTNNIEHVSGEWYKCEDLLFIMKTIDELIKKLNNNDDEVDFHIKIKNVVENESTNINKSDTKNIIKIIKKDNKLLLNYEYTINLLDIKEYKNMFNNITFIIKNIKYLEYEFFIWYINNNRIKNETFKKSIENINYILKQYILDFDIISTMFIVKNTIGLNFTEINLKIFKNVEYIETENCLKNHDINNYIDLSKNFINNNKKLLFVSINKNISYNNINSLYFIKEIVFEKVMITFKYNEKNIELTLNEYNDFIKKIRKRNINSDNIEFKNKIYFNYSIVILNDNIKSDYLENTYNLLDLDNNSLYELILDENIYEEFDIYINNKVKKIKKYNLYQLLYYNKELKEIISKLK